MPTSLSHASAQDWQRDLLALDLEFRRRALACLHVLRAGMASGDDRARVVPVLEMRLCPRRGPCPLVDVT